MGVEVGTTWRERDGFDAAGLGDVPELDGELRIAVHEDVSFVEQEAIRAVGELAGHLSHEPGIRPGGDAGDVDAARLQFHHEEDKKVTRPPAVQTSVVKKSVAARVSQWARRKSCQFVWRLRRGAGSRPWSLRIALTGLALMACPRLASIPARRS